MSRVAKLAAAAGLALGLLGPAGARQVNQPRLGRSVHGTVQDAESHPLPGAIVYMKDQRTRVIHTVITGDNGQYSFHQLTPNVSYEVYAEWKGRRSPARTDSEYETQPDVRLDLKVPVTGGQ